MGMMTLMAKTLRRTSSDLRTIAKVRVCRTRVRKLDSGKHRSDRLQAGIDIAFAKIYRILRYLTKRISEKIVSRRRRTARFSNSVRRIIS